MEWERVLENGDQQGCIPGYGAVHVNFLTQNIRPECLQKYPFNEVLKCPQNSIFFLFCFKGEHG